MRFPHLRVDDASLSIHPRVVVVDRHRHGQKLDGASVVAALARREAEVLCHVAEGLTNREIAGRMGIAEQTVKNYVSKLLANVCVSNRVQLALFASRNEASLRKKIGD